MEIKFKYTVKNTVSGFMEYGDWASERVKRELFFQETLPLSRKIV
jgi:hypothetical protein